MYICKHKKLCMFNLSDEHSRYNQCELKGTKEQNTVKVMNLSCILRYRPKIYCEGAPFIE